EDLRIEFRKSEDERTTKDPRWFSRFRDPKKNPITIQLRTDIMKADDAAERIRQQIRIVDRLTDLEKKSALLLRDNRNMNQRIQLWANKQIVEIRTDLEVVFTTGDQLKAAQAKLAKFEESIVNLSVDVNHADVALHTLRAILRADLMTVEF